MSNVTEVGMNTQFGYTPEVGFGVTPGSPAGQLVRWTSADFGADRSYTKNTEMRTDYQNQAGIPGGLRGKGSIKGKLSFGSFDDWFGYFLGCAAWQSNVVKIKPATGTGAISLACDATAKTWTRTVGSFLTDGFQVGDIINPNGFTNSANNGAFVATAVTATVLTTSGATTMITETAGTGKSINVDISPSFTMERGHKGNGIYFAFPGTVVDSFEMSAKAGSDPSIDISFGLLSKIVSQESASSVFTTTTAVNTNDWISSWNGSIKRNGVAQGDLTGWSLKGARNSATAEVVGSPDLYDIQPGAVTVTGTLDILFDSVQHYTDFRQQNDVAFQLNLGSGSSKSYTIDLTRCRITKWGAPPKEGMLTSSIEIEAVVPLSGTNTAFMLTRIP
jgi:hypothetical protein